jgi:hypothetical protein
MAVASIQPDQLALLASALGEAGIRPYFLPTLGKDGSYFVFVEEGSSVRATTELQRQGYTIDSRQAWD